MYSILLTGLILLSACAHSGKSGKPEVHSFETARVGITAVHENFNIVKDAEQDAITIASKPELAGCPPKLSALLHSYKWSSRALTAAKINQALLEAESAKALGEPWRQRAETLKQLDELLDGLHLELDTPPFIETATSRRGLILDRMMVLEVRKFVEKLPE